MEPLNETKQKRCPGCGRACDLDAPKCPRGEEYARTGILPEGGDGLRRGGHGREHHAFGPRHRGPRGKLIESPRYAQETTAGKLELLLRELGMPRRGERDAQDRALWILGRVGSMTQRDLTEHLGIQPGSASELIGKLETAGRLTRTTSEQDRRTQDVTLTEAGRERLREIETAWRETREHRFDALTGEEQAQLLALLEKLCR